MVYNYKWEVLNLYTSVYGEWEAIKFELVILVLYGGSQKLVLVKMMNANEQIKRVNKMTDGKDHTFVTKGFS